MQYIFMLVLSALLLVQTPCRAETFRLVTLDYPPYEFLDDDKPAGIATQIVRTVFQRMGHNVTIDVLPWSRALKIVQEGKADGIYTIFRTPEREKYLDYGSEILMEQVTSLFVLKSSPIRENTTLAELADRTFGVVRSVSYGLLFDENVRNATLEKLVISETGEENVRKLLLGRFEVLAGNRFGTWDILNKIGGTDKVRELKPSMENTPSFIAFSKMKKLEKLREDFDGTLADMKKNGSYLAMITAYFFSEETSQDSLQQVPMTKPE